MLKSRTFMQAWFVARMLLKILTDNLRGTGPLERTKNKWENNIRKQY